MAEYIERKALYRKLLEFEALARARVLDTPTTSPAYQRYSAQLTERNAIRHMIAEIPAADVAPVVHGRWVLEAEKGTCMDFHVKAHCSECGHKWFGENGVGNYSYVFSAFVRGPDEDAIAFVFRERRTLMETKCCGTCKWARDDYTDGWQCLACGNKASKSYFNWLHRDHCCEEWEGR